MNLVLYHVLEALVVGWSKEDLSLHLSSIEAVVHYLVPSKLIALFMKLPRDLLNSVFLSAAQSLERSRISFDTCE